MISVYRTRRIFLQRQYVNLACVLLLRMSTCQIYSRVSLFSEIKYRTKVVKYATKISNRKSNRPTSKRLSYWSNSVYRVLSKEFLLAQENIDSEFTDCCSIEFDKSFNIFNFCPSQKEIWTFLFAIMTTLFRRHYFFLKNSDTWFLVSFLDMKNYITVLPRWSSSRARRNYIPMFD